MSITTYNGKSRRKTVASTMISCTPWPMCAFFLGTPYCSLLYKAGLRT